jgi:hypothetical protein
MRAWELSGVLEEDAQLQSYPYQFKVISVKGEVATLASPRSAQVPAVKFLAILYPQLSGKGADSPAMVEAQKELAKYQAHARELIPDIERVRWQIDRDWDMQRGVILQ